MSNPEAEHLVTEAVLPDLTALSDVVDRESSQPEFEVLATVHDIGAAALRRGIEHAPEVAPDPYLGAETPRRHRVINPKRYKTAENETVATYLNQIGEYPLLTSEEVIQLAKLIEQGRIATARLETTDISPQERGSLKREARIGKNAKDHLINSNLRLVVSLASKYPVPPRAERQDLIQAGNLGLIHAAGKFDWRKGFKFSTYANFWIRKNIGYYIDRGTSPVVADGHDIGVLRRALRESQGDKSELPKDLHELDKYVNQDSLDMQLGVDGDRELVDILPDATVGVETDAIDHVAIDSILDLLAAATAELPEEERTALQLSYGIGNNGAGITNREIGAMYERKADWASKRVTVGRRRLLTLLADLPAQDRSLIQEHLNLDSNWWADYDAQPVEVPAPVKMRKTKQKTRSDKTGQQG